MLLERRSLAAYLVLLALCGSAMSQAQSRTAASAQSAGSTQQNGGAALAAPNTATAAAPSAVMPSDLAAAISQVERATHAAAGDLGAMHVDRWKTTGDVKQQTEQNVQSLTRNMKAALPGMVQQVRATPASMAAQFKLYRNLNALYDVFSSVTESAGAFGPKGDYDALANDLGAFDQARRALADRIEAFSQQQDSELTRLRSVQQAAAASVPVQTRKIVVDDSTPAKKSAKKRPAKPAAPQQ